MADPCVCVSISRQDFWYKEEDPPAFRDQHVVGLFRIAYLIRELVCLVLSNAYITTFGLAFILLFVNTAGPLVHTVLVSAAIATLAVQLLCFSPLNPPYSP